MEPVVIDPSRRPPDLVGRAARTAGEVAAGTTGAMLTAVADLAPHVPRPGGGATAARWEVLASVAAVDLTVARAWEPHLDAVAIGAEAEEPVAAGSSWGVWAAEGPDARLEARGDDATGWVLTGRKPWCSLAGEVTHGLLTAWVAPDRRRLFAVATDAPGVTVESATWAPTGLRRITTGPVRFDDVSARPVGADGWYLDRDGFWWGGIGVAAVWYGGAVGLARRLADQCQRREPDQVALMHLGEIDALLAGARAALSEAAVAVDAGRASGPDAVLLGARVRHVVATAAEDVARRVGHALGPGPLSQEPEHADRVADLALYLRQHHAERDAAGLGRMLLERAEERPW